MIPIDQFMAEIRRRGIFLKTDGKALHFDAPKGGMTPELRGQLLSRKPEILRFLTRLDLPRKPPLMARERGGDVPLSFAQQRMWFLHQIGGASPAYDMAAPLRLGGVLDGDAFERSLNRIVARHEVLRTRFELRRDGPCQEIADKLRLRIPLLDFGGLKEADRLREARRLADLEIHHRFDLSALPLVRCHMLRLSILDHGLLLNMHHIVSDGWSTAVLLKELGGFYHDFVAGRDPSPAPLKVQYADFALWQRGWLRGEVLEHYLEFWKNRLRAAPTLLALPTDRPRPAFQSHLGNRLHFSVDRSVVSQLERRCLELKVTRFVLLQTAFALLLSRYSGQDDLVIGSPVANRNHKALEPLIGFFVNTLPLRNRLEGDPSKRVLIERARTMVMDALAHQDLPFEKMVECLDLERHLSHQPLFQVMFIFQNLPLGKGRLRGTRIESFDSRSVTAKFDLTLTTMVTGGALEAALEYNSSLFDATTAGRFVEHFRRCLAFMAGDLAQPVSKLSLLSTADRFQLLREWNLSDPGQEADAVSGSLPSWFEAMAERHPDRTALVFEREAGIARGPETWSYEYLDRRAAALADRLRNLGIGTDRPAGIYLKRSPLLVQTVLAVFKAGGTCLPLNPDYPAERLGFMLADAGCRLLLTHQDLAPIPCGSEITVCRLDEITHDAGTRPPREEMREAPVSGLAYVIYTSGSTGLPKGVALTYAALVNLVDWSRKRWTKALVTIQFAPISFDIAFQEILVTLSCGERLVPISAETHRDPLALWRVIAEQRVGRLYLPYTALLQLAQTARPEFTTAADLREIIAAGEALRITDGLRDLFAALKRCSLHNHYGPSEAHVVTTFRLDGNPHVWPSLSPIGRPIGNTAIYLVDRRLLPVAVAVPCHLAIGGIPPARGYLGRARDSAPVFVPDPFSERPGRRIYLTGDLARFLADGNIEYLGRIDQQVKLRGYRVEPGEVETRLEEHAAIREAAVVPVTGQHGGQRLVSYIVPVGGGNRSSEEDPPGHPGPAELRAYLKTRIPDYMIPSDFVVLDRLPKTSSGKIDRRSLPKPDPSHSRAREAFVAAATPEERMMVGIWCQVLGLERVGIHDNFFGLGGDSILSLQVIARARHSGYELKPRHIFEYQSIAELVPQLVPADTDETLSEPVGVVGEVPLTPIQQFLLGRNLPDPHLLNIATMVITPPNLDAGFLERALTALVAHHDSLRLKLWKTRGRWHQEITPPKDRVPLHVFDLARVESRLQGLAIRQSAALLQESMDLGESPLIRVGLMRLGAGLPGRLVIAVNHIGADGFSFQLVLADLLSAYRDIALHDEARFPKKGTSYKEWAHKLQAAAQGEALMKEAHHWLNPDRYLVKRLPVDFEAARERNTRASIDRLTVSLDAGSTQRLLQDATRYYDAKINEIMIAALALSVAAWTGERRMLVDLNVHGREPLFEDVDVSRTVGCFTAMYPCFLEWPLGSSPVRILALVRNRLREIPNSGIGFGILRYLGSSPQMVAGMKALPKAEILFNYIGQSNMAQALSAQNALGPAPEPIGLAHNHEVVRPWLFNIDAQVTGGRLQLLWMYSRHAHFRNTVEALAYRFLDQLKSFLKTLG